jgi:hypothetical protein
MISDNLSRHNNPVKADVESLSVYCLGQSAAAKPERYIVLSHPEGTIERRLL